MYLYKEIQANETFYINKETRVLLTRTLNILSSHVLNLAWRMKAELAPNSNVYIKNVKIESLFISKPLDLRP